MGVEDVEAAHEEDCEAKNITPVHDAHRKTVPVIRITF